MCQLADLRLFMAIKSAKPLYPTRSLGKTSSLKAKTISLLLGLELSALVIIHTHIAFANLSHDFTFKIVITATTVCTSPELGLQPA